MSMYYVGFQSPLIPVTLNLIITAYRSHNPTILEIEVLDVNDNPPVFKFPVYPQQNGTTNNKYFCAISRKSHVHKLDFCSDIRVSFCKVIL
jgi:hypothetical protein